MGVRFRGDLIREDRNGPSHHQRNCTRRRHRSQHPAVVGDPGMGRPHRHQVRLRQRAMRRLHGPHRRRCRPLMRNGRQRCGRQADHHHRRPGGQRRPAQGAEGLDRQRRAAMRLLPERHDHGGRGAPQGEAEADRRRYRCGDHQHLPVRNLPAGARVNSRRGQRVSREGTMNYVPNMNRRSFVVGTAAVGGGLALGLDIPLGGPQVVRAADGSPEINAWVVIRPDDTVVVRVVRTEMGQGTLTGLAQLVAEELECDWSKVTTEYPTPGQSVARKRVWGDFSTGGRRGLRASHEYVHKGGATARIMLIQAAANEWKVPASECTAANSIITHPPSGRTTTYGKVAEAAAKVEPPTDVKLKDPKDWKLAGKGVKRLDAVDKTTGKMTYGIDIKLPGMLNAAIKACPVFGGKLKSFDEAKVTGMKGVKKVVKVGDNAVAVVADTWWHAKTALEALPLVWDEGEDAKVSSASIAKGLDEGLDDSQPAFVGNQSGDAKAAFAGAAKKIEAVYNYPYQNHAAMEPLNATALYTADKCEVWGGKQNGEHAFV